MTAQTSPYYNLANVVTGDSVLYIAPANTPMAAETSDLFDPTNWIGKVLTANSATAVTLSVTNSQGTQVTASITGFATETAAALQAVLVALSNVGTDASSGLPNVIVTGIAGGPFTVVFSPALGATTLAVTASTGGTGPTVSGGLWVPPGATQAGWTFSGSRQTNPITVEEQSTPAGMFIQSQTITIGGSMSEDTSTNWQFALNAVKTLIAAGAGQPAVTQLAVTDDLQHYAAVLESRNQLGYPSRIYIPDVVSTDTLTVQFRRSQQQHFIPLMLSAVCPTSKIVIRKVTAPATS